MKITTHSAVPVYTISGSSTARPLPDWLARKRKRSLKNDPEFANRIELLQDFEFEEASCCIRASEDGQWVMSTGTYKPQIHTHYLPHLSLSFARHTTSLNLTFLLLSSDYSKSLHLQTDRSLEFHTPQGCHYTTRLPRYGRDLKYDRRSAEALVPAVGVNGDGQGEVFRLNLEVGRFMKGYEVDVGGDDLTSAGGGALQGGIATGSVNTAAIAEESHNLLAFGTSIGTVEFWDPRSRGRVGLLSTPSDFTSKPEVTALEFHRSGLTLATGSSAGIVHLYDLRSPIPLLEKDQGYGYPIQTLTFLTPSTAARGQTTESKILSADKRIIKMWDVRDGSPWTSVEPAVDINSVAWCKDSGMLLTANEGRQQHSFFIPQLGPAPKWCSFLDSVVEELAEDPDDPSAFKKTGEVYDNFKFLTMAQLKVLNLSHLAGTNTLKPYMHGYFVHSKLYDQAKAITDPFVWEEERARRIKEKVDKERDSRIRGSKSTPKVKVNRKLAEKGVSDPRFAQAFEDEDFAVDEESHVFKLINPSSNQTKQAAGQTDKSGDERPKPSKVDMQISSSTYRKSGHRSQLERTTGTPLEPSLGAKRSASSTEQGSKSVGEKEASWKAGGGKSSRAEAARPSERRRDHGRRLASKKNLSGQ
ncbi:MAG: hypothetical protein M1832_001602 [Thelocarpon impressellum]|nr:MAG: hypothetical protein M1832_001602 [Thelocarpon impressellum]